MFIEERDYRIKPGCLSKFVSTYEYERLDERDRARSTMMADPIEKHMR